MFSLFFVAALGFKELSSSELSALLVLLVASARSVFLGFYTTQEKNDDQRQDTESGDDSDRFQTYITEVADYFVETGSQHYGYKQESYQDVV